MPSISYKQVYSRFYTKVTAYDLVFNNLTDEQVEQFLCSYLHSSISYPMIRKLFSQVVVDDDQQKIDYTMTYVIDETSDKEFVLDVLSAEMAVKWITPKVSNLSTVVQFFGSSESKFFSQAPHLEQLRALKADMQNEVRSLIADRGGEYNTYLDGTSATATMRSNS